MSNLSDIGFPVAGEQDVNQLLMSVLDHVQPIPCPKGFYLKFTDPSGAELYLQGNKDQELIGFNPHFAGKSNRKVGLINAIDRDSSELDGGFHCRAAPNEDDIADSGEYPFVFDVPDFRMAGEIDFPKVCEIQLTAFASNDFVIYENEDDYHRDQDTGLKFAARHFIPSGLFLPDEQSTPIEPPRPIGIFAGHITEFELKTNQFSGQEFYWFLVETLGGEIDVVADPKLVEKDPKTGGIVKGQFWLSGRKVR